MRIRALPGILAALASLSLSAQAPPLDLVVAGGRVIDPASGLDAVRSVGVRDGRIVAVSETPLSGRVVIDAAGLVVAPGFIDLHTHTHTDEGYRLYAMDGVTTALELEVGTREVGAWYAQREGKARVNYGVAAGHIPNRMHVFGDPGELLPSAEGGRAVATPEQLERIRAGVAKGLAEGALGVGFGLQYTPAATRWEVIEMFRVAAAHGATAFVHNRAFGAAEPGSSVESFLEVIGASALTGAPLHIVHLNSMSLQSTRETLGMVREAQSRGLKVTTEAYPYSAGQTRIESALLDQFERGPDSELAKLQWVKTGERLTRETFQRYRREGGSVILHLNTPEMEALAIESPLTAIASDAGITNGQGHPRAAGTFARVLGYYVREKRSLTLMEAIRKSTLMPARVMEPRAPAFRTKGRLQPGMDADIAIFDPDTVIDRSTYERPGVPSEGFRHVIVGGVSVVRDGRLVDGVFPGRGVRAPVTDVPGRDWAHYAAEPSATHYSPLDRITPGNVAGLSVAWEWRPGEKARPEFGTRPGAFQNTPLAIDGVLYVSTPYNQVAALDAGTGRELWRFDPRAYEDGQPPNGQGFAHRGVAAWRDPAVPPGSRGGLRIFLNSRYRLFALDALTGAPIDGFGVNGAVDLSEGLVWPVNKRHYTNTSPPIVFNDLVIVGNGVGDRLMYRNDPPGDVRAFSVRTGKLAWKFNTVPRRGEFGNETWDNGSWRFTGHTNVWAPMSLDEARGLLYLPVSTPSNDYYGGRRPGANLFAESLVCLDAATGERRWHYQIVHHGLWDYDLASAPNLVTLTVDGRRIDAVAQLTKQGFAFVFDRVTGRPVWPIEERPVPRSDVPGEASWPTQPFPTRPPAFESQGMTLDEAFDLTPALEARARAELQRYVLGPIYTPPSLKGTVALPGVWGGANWGGGAWDPETGRLYVKTSRSPSIFKIERFDKAAQPKDRLDEVDAEWVNRSQPTAVEGVPLVKPPYAHLVAIDLNRGDIAWKVPFGDAPELRALPQLSGVTLPDRLGAGGPPGAIVTRGGLVFVGGNDMALSAFDKRTGREVWRHVLPRQATATPMTFLAPDGRQMVVVATGRGEDTALVAFALPR